MKYPKVISQSHFHSHPLLTYDGLPSSYNENILQRIEERFNFMFTRHSQVLIYSMVFKYPDNGIAYPQDNSLFQNCIESYKRYLDRHNFSPQFIWVREQNESRHPHFHLCVMLNGNAIRYLKNDLEPHRLWNLALGLPLETQGLVHFSDMDGSGNWSILVHRDDHALQDKVFAILSYLAKTFSKQNKAIRGLHEFGCSHMPE